MNTMQEQNPREGVVVRLNTTQRAVDEVTKRASLLGYGLVATQSFQREAVRLSEESNLTPAQIARHVVPAKSATLAEFLRATYAAIPGEIA